MSAEDQLKRLDRHDLKILQDFWRGEVKLLVNGEPLAGDLELAKSKLERLNAEIERRTRADG